MRTVFVLVFLWGIFVLLLAGLDKFFLSFHSTLNWPQSSAHIALLICCTTIVCFILWIEHKKFVEEMEKERRKELIGIYEKIFGEIYKDAVNDKKEDLRR